MIMNRCDKCEFTSTDETNFKDHLETHDDFGKNNMSDTHFACNKCEFRTKEKNLFNTHIISCLFESDDNIYSKY